MEVSFKAHYSNIGEGDPQMEIKTLQLDIHLYHFEL